MRIVGVMLVRNESWVCRLSIEAALRWVDHLVVLNHQSTDETRIIAARFANATGRVTVEDWEDGEYWREMDARQRSLEIARRLESTHIAIIDADEVLTANYQGRVRGLFERLKPGHCLNLPMVCPWDSLDVYARDVDSILTLGFADRPDLAWKPRGAEGYHHHARPPQGSISGSVVTHDDGGGVFHLQWANLDHKTWKDRHYVLTERLRWGYEPAKLNAKYSWWRRLGLDRQAIPPHWWGDYDKSLVWLDGESWYEGECKRLIAAHGWQIAEGLDLWGWEHGA